MKFSKAQARAVGVTKQDDQGRWICPKGCGTSYAEMRTAFCHVETCDGTPKIPKAEAAGIIEKDEHNMWLCPKGCGRTWKLRMNGVSHVKKCDGNPKLSQLEASGITEKDKEGNWVCPKGCGSSHKGITNAVSHVEKCDGIRKISQAEVAGITEKDEQNMWLCPKGCGMTWKARGNGIFHVETCDGTPLIPKQPISTIKIVNERLPEEASGIIGENRQGNQTIWLGETGNPLLLNIGYQEWRMRILSEYSNGITQGFEPVVDFGGYPSESCTTNKNEAILESDELEGFLCLNYTTDENEAAWELDDLNGFLSSNYTANELLDDSDDEEYEYIDIEQVRPGWKFQGVRYSNTADRNKAVIEKYAYTTPPKNQPCPGFKWKHGYVKCAKSNVISLETGWARSCKSYGWEKSCCECYHNIDLVAVWIRKGKYNAQGEHLCSATQTCREKALPNGLCSVHGESARAARKRIFIRKHAEKLRGKFAYGITTSQETKKALEHLESRKLKIRVAQGTPWYNALQSLNPRNKPNSKIWYIDCEFCNLVGRTLLSWVRVPDVDGNVILNEQVRSDGLTPIGLFNLIHDLSSGDKHRKTLFGNVSKNWGLYPEDKDIDQKVIPGISIEALERKFREVGIKKTDIMFGWSLSNCDYHAIRKNFSPTADIPGQQNWLRVIPLWRTLMPGFLSFRLDLCFPLFFPEEVDLSAISHVASYDAKKLYRMTALLIPFLCSGDKAVIPLLENSPNKRIGKRFADDDVKPRKLGKKAKVMAILDLL